MRSYSHCSLWSEEKVEAYLTGKLSAAEENDFEDHYVLCPDCVDLLESTDRFIRSVRAAGEIIEGSTASRLGPRRATESGSARRAVYQVRP